MRAAVPASQATGDLAFTEATKALREFNATEAAELAQAGADEAAIAEAMAKGPSPEDAIKEAEKSSSNPGRR